MSDGFGGDVLWSMCVRLQFGKLRNLSRKANAELNAGSVVSNEGPTVLSALPGRAVEMMPPDCKYLELSSLQKTCKGLLHISKLFTMAYMQAGERGLNAPRQGRLEAWC